MQHSSPYRHQHPQRQLARRIQSVFLIAVSIPCLSLDRAFSQSKPVAAGKSPLCSRDNALDMIKQQVELTKTFNSTIRRITVLIRAADLLWPYQQDRARAAFTEAFDLATQNERESETERLSFVAAEDANSRSAIHCDSCGCEKGFRLGQRANPANAESRY